MIISDKQFVKDSIKEVVKYIYFSINQKEIPDSVSEIYYERVLGDVGEEKLEKDYNKNYDVFIMNVQEILRKNSKELFRGESKMREELSYLENKVTKTYRSIITEDIDSAITKYKKIKETIENLETLTIDLSEIKSLSNQDVERYFDGFEKDQKSKIVRTVQNHDMVLVGDVNTDFYILPSMVKPGDEFLSSMQEFFGMQYWITGYDSGEKILEDLTSYSEQDAIIEYSQLIDFIENGMLNMNIEDLIYISSQAESVRSITWYVKELEKNQLSYWEDWVMKEKENEEIDEIDEL